MTTGSTTPIVTAMEAGVIIAATPICKLVTKPLTKLFWSKMWANQRSG